MNPKLLKAAEAAVILRVSPRTLIDLTKSNQGPPAVRVGQQFRYPEDELEAWLKANMLSKGARA